MPQARGKVLGPYSQHRTVFYGLSTCIWCRRMRQFLESQGVEFDYVYVDLLRGQEREEALEKIRAHSRRSLASFPTVVVDGDQCIVGYKPEELQEVLGL